MPSMGTTIFNSMPPPPLLCYLRFEVVSISIMSTPIATIGFAPTIEIGFASSVHVTIVSFTPIDHISFTFKFLFAKKFTVTISTIACKCSML
jgi:hypothetical protein